MEKYYNSKFYDKPIEVVNIGGEILVIIIDNKGREIIYTWYDVVEKNTESIYINKCLLGGFIKKIPKNVLIIGFGGGAFAKYLEDHVENTCITGIDIDETMIDIAKKELNVKTNDFYIMDSQTAIDKITVQKITYDLILIDIYGGDGEIPEYLCDERYFSKLKIILEKNGVISINFADYNINDPERYDKYEKINNNLINVFGKYYSHLSIGENNRGNVIGIYNLDKFYSACDYNNKYLKYVETCEIIFDEKIIRNTVILE